MCASMVQVSNKGDLWACHLEGKSPRSSGESFVTRFYNSIELAQTKRFFVLTLVVIGAIWYFWDRQACKGQGHEEYHQEEMHSRVWTTDAIFWEVTCFSMVDA